MSKTTLQIRQKNSSFLFSTSSKSSENWGCWIDAVLSLRVVTLSKHLKDELQLQPSCLLCRRFRHCPDILLFKCFFTEISKKILLIPNYYWGRTLWFTHNVGVIHCFTLSHRVRLTNADSLRLKFEVVVCTVVWNFRYINRFLLAVHFTNRGVDILDRSFKEWFSHVSCWLNVVSLVTVSSHCLLHGTNNLVTYVLSMLWLWKVVRFYNDSGSLADVNACYGSNQPRPILWRPCRVRGFPFLGSTGGFLKWGQQQTNLAYRYQTCRYKLQPLALLLAWEQHFWQNAKYGLPIKYMLLCLQEFVNNIFLMFFAIKGYTLISFFTEVCISSTTDLKFLHESHCRLCGCSHSCLRSSLFSSRRRRLYNDLCMD